ncbi:hypothetical protein GMORB2_7770 [Geosmithia morbida]|uniref:Uncharacterized protein n=1 Tax=Geosmithia morbida TaxID=1094350 RepID=A0A9P5D0Z5_9HYPO|nr:uncharacterized protein GMORB2_7770 [Geosmithia morbida]KAF4122177.1 hypothetical protein GMORB2_7770 [Geosmithia morbida]
MARFSFGIPGRSKKQPVPVPPPLEHMSKAQRILGSDPLSPTSWEDSSASGVSASVPETAPSSSRGDDPARRPPREWGDDSDVVPRYLRFGTAEYTDDEVYSQYTRAPREQPSDSTIKSWYDKSKQPLAISQQTSASAMAKGLPSKAQRLLDMDNIYSHTAQPRDRKKPAHLDLSRVAKPAGHAPGRDVDCVMSPDSMASPSSAASPATPERPRRSRRRLTKQSTHESLKRDAAAAAAAAAAAPAANTAPRPETSGSQRQRARLQQLQEQQAQLQRRQQTANKFSDISNLYRHYEQMSFSQFMDEIDDDPDKAHGGEALRMDKDPAELARTLDLAPDAKPVGHRRRRDDGPLGSHPMPEKAASRDAPPTQHSQHSQASSSGSQNGMHAQLAQAPRRGSDQLSPTDCASISSRHTRTSKASFQLSELQDKSVLMLSSDSEGDDDETSYVGGLARDSASSIVPDAPAPGFRGSSMLSDPSTLASVASDDSQSARGRGSVQTFRNTSSTSTGFFAMHTTHLSSKSNTSLPMTASSAGTLDSQPKRESYGIQQARAVTLVSARGPRSDPSDKDAAEDDLSSETDKSSSRRRSSARQSLAAPSSAGAAFTPPLSPSSVESYLQPAQPAQPGKPAADEGGQVMGLTHQEKMLIHALRQRREQMRRNGPPDAARPQRSLSAMGHRCNMSEATIMDDCFGFPAPPADRGLRANGRVSSAQSANSSIVNLTIPEHPNDRKRDGEPPSSSSAQDDAVFLVSPPPSSHHRKDPFHASSKALSRKLRSSASHDSFRPRSTRRQPTPVTTQPMLEDDRSWTKMDLGGLTHTDSTSSWLPRSRSITNPTHIRSSLPAPPRPTADSVRRQNSTATHNHHHQDSTESSRRNKGPARITGRHHTHWDIAEEERLPAPPTRPHPPKSRLPPQPRSQPWRLSAETDSDDYDGEEPGIPRPDSPISPMTRPTVMGGMIKPGVRLSAFGPPATTGQFAWWGNED